MTQFDKSNIICYEDTDGEKTSLELSIGIQPMCIMLYINNNKTKLVSDCRMVTCEKDHSSHSVNDNTSGGKILN